MAPVLRADVSGPACSSFEHATSEDLLAWTRHGPVVEAGGQGDCDAYEVADRCIIEHGGRRHLVYTARPYLGASRRFAMAVSDDLWRWSKHPGDGSPTFIPDRELSGWREEGMMECKDPSIIYQDGRYLMYYICQKLVEPVDEPMKQTHTGINVATSTDLHVHGIVPTTRTQLKHGIHRARCGLDNACAVVFCLIAVIIRSGEQVEPVGQIPIQTWALAHRSLGRTAARLCQVSQTSWPISDHSVPNLCIRNGPVLR